MAPGTRKNFIFQVADLERLQRLKSALELPTETDVIRAGLALVEGLLEDGLSGTSQPMKDGRRVINLSYAPGRTVTLAEQKDGSYYAGAWGGPAVDDNEAGASWADEEPQV